MNRLGVLGVASLLLVGAAGCDSKVTTGSTSSAGGSDPCGDQGCPDDGWTSGGNSGSGGAPMVGHDGIAILRGEQDTGREMLATTSIPQEDADSLMLYFANNPLACDLSTGQFGGGDASCQAGYAANINITYGHQQVGTYALADLNGNIEGSYLTTREPDGNGGCNYATASFVNGTLEILEIDAAHVKFTIEDSDYPEINGTRNVPHCGGEPFHPSPDFDAIAMTHEQLDEILKPDTSSSSGGDEPPADRLVVLIDPSGYSSTASCGDPTGAMYCYGTVLMVGIDASLLTPGVYPTNGETVTVSEIIGGADAPECEQGGVTTTFTDGSVEIEKIDTNSITVRLVGGPVSAPLEKTAARCL